MMGHFVARMTGMVVLLMLLTGVVDAVADPHPYLPDVPENQAWLAPSGTEPVQNFQALDPGQHADVVLRRDKVLGRTLPVTVTTDAQMLMLVHGEDKLLFKLSGRADSPQMLELRGLPAEVRLDHRAVVDAAGAWPKMMQAAGGDTLTLRFVGATKFNLQFPTDKVDPGAGAFFGISADPSDLAYQQIAEPSATPPPASRPVTDTSAELSNDALPDRLPEFVPPEPPAPHFATDFPEVATADVVAKVQPATVLVEARMTRPGVTAVTHGFFVSDDGTAVVLLDAIADATELRVTYAPAGVAGPTIGVADCVMLDAAKGLALIKVKLAEGTKVQPLQLAQLRPGEGVKLWVVTAPSPQAPSYCEGHSGSMPRGGDDAWVSVHCPLCTTDAGAVIVNPLGEAVAIASWQSSQVQHHNALSVEAVAAMIKQKPQTPPALGGLRDLRADGSLPGHAPASLRIDRPQPASALQGEVIDLKRNYVCSTCKGKGEMEKKVHKTAPGINGGSGKEWYEISMIPCSTCKGGKLVAAAALTRMLQGLAETLAMGDTADPKWDAACNFAAQTLDEIVKTSPQELHSVLVDSTGRFDPAKLRLGQSVLIVGRAEAMQEPAVLLTPDCAYITPAGSNGVVMVGLRMNRGRSGIVLASGLYAGQLRMPNGVLVPVLQNGLTLSLSDTGG